MLKRLVRLILISAVVAAVVYVVRSLSRSQGPLPSVPEPSGKTWPPLRPEPARGTANGGPSTATEAAVATEPRPAESEPVNESPETGVTWVEATAEGECPDGFPIKANMNSKIFHSPGQLAYARTHPDRCYATAEGAEADGLRAAKR